MSQDVKDRETTETEYRNVHHLNPAPSGERQQPTLPRSPSTSLPTFVDNPNFLQSHHNTMKPPAYKLPHLLSLLPKDGKSALVRPVQWPSNSFYKVQKSALKFRPVEGSSEIRAGGRAYGQLFWKGEYCTWVMNMS